MTQAPITVGDPVSYIFGGPGPDITYCIVVADHGDGTYDLVDYTFSQDAPPQEWIRLCKQSPTIRPGHAKFWKSSPRELESRIDYKGRVSTIKELYTVAKAELEKGTFSQ